MKKLVWFVIFIVLIFFIGKWYISFLNSPADVNEKYSTFVIGKGEGTSSIAQRLEKQKFIRSSLIFQWDLKSDQKGVIQAGDFKISPSQSTPEIIKTFKSGTLDKWVTLLEGWRVEEMAEKLNKELGISSEEFLKIAKEGYMFPDTYLFNPKASVETIASVQRDNFDQKYSDDLKNKINDLGLTSNQGVILASIVEREARSPQARKMVASILLKRFKIGMGLNADATIQYALGYQQAEKSWWKKVITQKDKEIKSPYNTYLNAGFPPAPICNPSLSSLTAVSDADPTVPYLYYYHDSKGNSYYDKTLEEHDQNVANHP